MRHLLSHEESKVQQELLEGLKTVINFYHLHSGVVYLMHKVEAKQWLCFFV